MTDIIEQLRDILRECDLALSFMPQPTKTLEIEQFRDVLRECMSLLDDGVLVRDTTQDDMWS